MARSTANKLYRTFVKGLVTEASPLTYPEDTSYDELNTVLSRKGSRTRRPGINYNADTITPETEVTDHTISENEFIWKAVSENSDVNFLVMQKGLTIYFFDMATTDSDSSFKSFTIDLNEYLISSFAAANAKSEVFQMASGKGVLFIVGRPINPLIVQYDVTTDDITVNPVKILIRDFDGLADGLANDQEPPTLSKEHHYNLMNQGWLGGQGSASSEEFPTTSYDGYTLSSAFIYYQYQLEGTPITEDQVAYASPAAVTNGPIQQFFNELGRYPGNNKQWWVAKAAADDPDAGVVAGQFLPEVLDKIYSGNNKAPSGHFILDAFYQDRSGVSGISDIPIRTFSYRPEAIAFFSGRAWYGCGSTVYFSQILDSTGISKAMLCYQEADPTAENISDLIASDGGVVPIPEANRIRKLVPLGNGVIVIAENGVWFISGGEAAFSAVNISMSKVSSIGTRSPLAAIEVDETLFWWNETGIQAMQQASGQFGPIPGKFGNTNISEQTIQSLFNAIDEDAKKYVKVEFDPRNNRLLWLFNDAFENNYQYNKCLIFDITLQAFFLWEFGQMVVEDGEGPIVTGLYNDIGQVFAEADEAVLDGDGEVVVDEEDETVIASISTSIYAPTNIRFFVNIPGEGGGTATITDTAYVDWSSWDGEGVEFDSFIETGFELMGDSMRDKQAIYVFTHFTRDDDSSCKMRSKWDWSNSVDSNRWSVEVEAYRERIRPSNSTANLEAYDVVTTKNKVRGSGKAIQFRFGTSERRKNFELLGWAVAFIGNTQP